MDTECTSCHKDWSTGSFVHKVTGLALDITHSEFDCEDCHENRNFTAKPTCSNCHDDIKFPKFKTGRIVALGNKEKMK